MPTNRLVTKEIVATYARALLDAANEAGGQDAVLEVLDQLEQIVGFTRSNMDLSAVLAGRNYAPEQRSIIVRNVFEGFNEVLVSVIAVMAERGDGSLLSRIWHSYEELIESEFDVAVADVTTAVALDDELRQVIIKKLETDLGRTVTLREHVDTSILGGIIMSAKGKRIDASVVSQLENARNVLKLSTDGGES